MEKEKKVERTRSQRKYRVKEPSTRVVLLNDGGGVEVLK